MRIEELRGGSEGWNFDRKRREGMRLSSIVHRFITQSGQYSEGRRPCELAGSGFLPNEIGADGCHGEHWYLIPASRGSCGGRE